MNPTYRGGRLPTVKELLSTLVECPSVNPGSALTFESPFGEDRLVSWLAQFLEPWADEVTVQEVSPSRHNLIARFDGRNPFASFAFEAHSDTVGVEGMTVEPWTAKVSEGRLYGRGACDTKGPMTAMILAILRCLETNGRLPVTMYFISTCDEELGGSGARHLVQSGFHCDGLVVGEPTSLVPVDCHKGAARFRVHFHGRAGHSSYPEIGVNAIHAASDFIVHLRRLVASSSMACDPAIGPPTVSVGTLQGGDQVNRIPDRVVMEIDLRIPPGIPVPAQEWIDQATSSTLRDFPDARIESIKTQHYPAFHLEPEAAFRKSIRPLFPLNQHSYGKVRYATNAGFFAEAGLPCIVFGPGSVGDAHTSDESIELDEVETGCRALRDFIEQASVSVTPELVTH